MYACVRSCVDIADTRSGGNPRRFIHVRFFFFLSFFFFLPRSGGRLASPGPFPDAPVPLEKFITLEGVRRAACVPHPSLFLPPLVLTLLIIKGAEFYASRIALQKRASKIS